MDSHQKGGLVDHNLRKVVVGRLNRNGPNTGKRCTWSTDTDVKDVLGLSPGSEGIGSWGSSHDSDRDCGKESTRWKEWQVEAGRCEVGCEWEMT